MNRYDHFELDLDDVKRDDAVRELTFHRRELRKVASARRSPLKLPSSFELVKAKEHEAAAAGVAQESGREA